ncbi:DUF2863 family protein [Noviherbaspirillum sp.]|jgi:hypothetical protein|uniref:DUF2863 family protein n=1 Tax=Noviherbaspirillum sp. TaxID=1926288 RepID=UPI0025EDA1BE|nr:DUF2863 family protein [Noviherbaspirillum sp.]
MHKSKRPALKKTVEENQDDALAHKLASLAIELDARKDRVAKTDNSKNDEADFHRLIRKCLQQKKDEALQEAIDIAEESDRDACRLLRENIEEASENVVFRREDGRELEVNAFVVPLFARSGGGLRAEQCFQDEEAFDLLRTSFLEAQLESRDASVVLVSHAYHPDEIRGITYSQINAMVREAYDSMTRKKAVAAPAIEQSMSGWPESHFAPDDVAVELRFLLGFTLKRMDDPFYQVPKKEAAADAYFETRAKRFQQWAQQVAPLVKRCLVTDGRDVEIDFLYQDLFHGGTARGFAEYDTLQMMAELHHGLDDHGIDPEHAHAVVGPTDIDGEMFVRVNLHANADDALLVSSEKAIGTAGDWMSEVEDACDALTTIGVKSVSLAMKFDADGNAVDVRPYKR